MEISELAAKVACFPIGNKLHIVERSNCNAISALASNLLTTGLFLEDLEPLKNVAQSKNKIK